MCKCEEQNKGRVIEFVVPQEDVNVLERLTAESNAINDNIHFLMNEHKNDADFLDTALFLRYEKKQIAKLDEYNKAKEAFERKFVPTELISPKTNWSVAFRSCLLTITTTLEEAGDCTCEKENA